MAADQKNSKLWKYVAAGATEYSLRGPIDASINAIDGSAVLAGGEFPFGRQTKRRHPRRAVYQDPTTFRTLTFPVFTQAALDALDEATALPVHVPGETAAVDYFLSARIQERFPVNKASKNLSDHT